MKRSGRNGRLVLKQVPWMNKLELETVYAKVYSKDPLDQRWAVDRISLWRARNPAALPVGADTTECIVRAMIQDYTVQNNISLHNFSDVSLAYGMALVRFVNLVSEELQPHDCNLPLRQIATKNGIPDWIVQLRHQTAHSSTPPLENLRRAAEECLEWLDDFFWKLEIANTVDYQPEFCDTSEDTCRNTLSDFQKLQYEYLIGSENSGGKRKLRSSLKQAVCNISALAKKHGETLTNLLAKPEFLLSMTACSKPLLESSDDFIAKEAVTLPKSVELFWQPVICALNQEDLLGELVLVLLKSHNKLSDEHQRMAIAWAWEILHAAAESWGAEEKKISTLGKVLKLTPVLNWFELLDECLHSLSKYIPVVLPILVEHIYPPIPTSKKNSLLGLVAIATGALADGCLKDDMSTEGQRVYNVENIKTVLELQEVVDRGETSLYFTNSCWDEVCTDDINWEENPAGTVFGLENNVLKPDNLELSVLTRKNETKVEIPSEAAVVAMECDGDKTLNDSNEESTDKGKKELEEDLEMQEDEPCINFNADYCEPEDIIVL